MKNLIIILALTFSVGFYAQDFKNPNADDAIKEMNTFFTEKGFQLTENQYKDIYVVLNAYHLKIADILNDEKLNYDMKKELYHERRADLRKNIERFLDNSQKEKFRLFSF